MLLSSGRRPRRAALGRAVHVDQSEESAGPSGHRRGARMRRRDLLLMLTTGMIGARTVRAQQKAMPVIGYLSQRSPTDSASIVAAFRQGLKQEGYVDGQNVAIESRFAEGQIDRLSGLATDLVRYGVNVFVATGGTGSVVNARPVVPDAIATAISRTVSTTSNIEASLSHTHATAISILSMSTPWVDALP